MNDLKKEFENLSLANQEKILDYFANRELSEYEKEFDKMALTVANVCRIFEKTWQLFDTYNDEETLQILFNTSEGVDNVWEMRFDCNEKDVHSFIHKFQDISLRYEMHQYGDYATIFFTLSEKGISVDSPFLNDSAELHLIEDLEKGTISSEQWQAALDNCQIETD